MKVMRTSNGDLAVDPDNSGWRIISDKKLWHTVGDKKDWEWKRMSEKWRSWGYEIIDEYKS